MGFAGLEVEVEGQGLTVFRTMYILRCIRKILQRQAHERENA